MRGARAFTGRANPLRLLTLTRREPCALTGPENPQSPPHPLPNAKVKWAGNRSPAEELGLLACDQKFKIAISSAWVGEGGAESRAWPAGGVGGDLGLQLLWAPVKPEGDEWFQGVPTHTLDSPK